MMMMMMVMMMIMCKRLAQVPMLCVPIYNMKLGMMQKTPTFTTFSAHTKMAADKRGQIEVFARITTNHPDPKSPLNLAVCTSYPGGVSHVWIQCWHCTWHLWKLRLQEKDQWRFCRKKTRSCPWMPLVGGSCDLMDLILHI